MTTWHWIRHGPTHEKTFVGWRDVPADLSDRARLDRLRDHLPQDALVISSDLARARETADALTSDRHRRLPHDPHLREIHFGLWDGLPFDEISAQDPDLSRAFWETPGEITAPGGESWNMTSARVNAAVDRINARFPGRHVIAVAHFGVILTQVQRAMGSTPYEAFAHKIDNLSVTEVRWQNGKPQAARINHLP